MAINFPDSPTLDQTFTSGNTIWKWDGIKWNATTAGMSLTQSIRTITGATDTPTSNDKSLLLVISTTTGTVSITINSSLGLSAGERIDFLWTGAATAVTFSGTAPATINGVSATNFGIRARYSAATLICTASNTYILIGDLS